MRFKEHFREYKIVVYHSQNRDNIMFEGQLDAAKRLNILYDDVERHYHVILNLTGAMSREYVCEGCNKACTSDVTHVCDQTCSDWMANTPCAFSNVRILCDDCNRHFKSPNCFANHKQRTKQKRSVCKPKRCCVTCGWVVTHEKHEFIKRFCDKCKHNREVDHLRYMRPLKDALAAAGGKVFKSFMISRQPKIPGTWTRLSYTYLISSACNNSVRGARTWKTEDTACDALGGNTRSGKILSGTYFHI